MTYYPHTIADRQKMLQTIGVDSIEALFAAVPEAVRSRRWIYRPA
ncbi:MAG TPA: hypothetical protein VF177_02035 [Anaerolineae bacterium]